MNIAPRFLQTS